jgi:NADH-quinone oxidoreductase subunit K
MFVLTPYHFLFLSVLLMTIAFIGILVNRQNIIKILICIELILLCININFVTFSHMHYNVIGQVATFFILTVAAAEAAIGLAILVVYYRKNAHIDVEKMTTLQG